MRPNVSRLLPALALIITVLIVLSSCGTPPSNQYQEKHEVLFPAIMVAGVETAAEVLTPDRYHGHFSVIVGEDAFEIAADSTLSAHLIPFIPAAHQPVTIIVNNTHHSSTGRAIPLWYGLIPPLLAIAWALFFREVFSALILGLLSGTWMIAWYGGHTIITAAGVGLLRIIDTYIVATMTSSDHVSIIVFSLMIGGMVHVITLNGGMKGVVLLIMKVAGTRRSTLLSTWLMGLVLFFDDYANTLVVGNTMRPLSDRMRISREKLSYVVDSTAAPVAAVAFITTWIGAELSYIKDALEVIAAGTAPAIEASPYAIFMGSLGYAFYPFLTLLFVVMLIWSGRDYGAMYHAEQRTLLQTTPESSAEEDPASHHNPATAMGEAKHSKPRAVNALLPVITVITGAFTGLIITGMEHTAWQPQLGLASNLSEIIGQADTFRALLWASFSGLLLAILLTVSQKLLSLQKVTEGMVEGFKTMLHAMLILVLAWALAMVTRHLHTAEYLSHVMIASEITPRLIPLLTFLLAAGVAFSTGSSWSTMAILFPLLLPTSWNLFFEFQLDQPTSMMLFHATVASVLAGAVMGDHCSPISDTTILSSLATQCNHIDHVKTQLPYALTTGTIAMAAGIIPTSYGLHPLAAFAISTAIAYGIIRWLGKKHHIPPIQNPLNTGTDLPGE